MRTEVRIDEKEKTISFLDDRFYLRNGIYYPSVTTILDTYPKGVAFKRWLQSVGFEAEFVANEAAESGIKVENGFNMLSRGLTMEWNDKKYDTTEWKGIMAAKDFLLNFVDSIEELQKKLYDKDEMYAGTADVILIIDGKRWLIDVKFGNNVYPQYFLQIAAYKHMWDKTYPDKKIDEIGILWLKGKTRGRDKSEKRIQGKGWKLINPKDATMSDTGGKDFRKQAEHHDLGIYEFLYRHFKHVHSVWKFDNFDARPKNRVYPSVLEIEKFKEDE